ncbi:protein mono-ADP-ribosyltransferase PARP14-like [Xenia sp. Carnegie-2017]|uniref:protein mono-ADP-ribosyltransferase PARP14-like n=1 Tax=Xenia sp. Carnegie-2017 TaxID=2897299 RepID=UPI001F04EEE4|nr:protein mono-ADP-ribosyltransferase PARP14-like [Xenia sp. Carnegie-2017]
MSQSSLYVSNFPDGTTLDDLVIYFQSKRYSGGGDVDFDASKVDGNNAVIVFERNEDLQNVLQRHHKINGCELEVSSKQSRPLPKQRSPSTEKARLGEVRSIIVRGFCSDITDDTIRLFFESEMRSEGGEIEKFERRQQDVAFITFKSAEVAARVLAKQKLELCGYLLQMKGEQPELYLSRDKRKLFVENIDPRTHKDGLTFYMEALTSVPVQDIWMGNEGKAIVFFHRDLENEKVIKKNRKLDGAALRISFPPVCNSVLVRGLSSNTAKDTIEMYFEREQNGGGKIYGDIIHQKDKGIAVVSFCDPDVLDKLISKNHRLDNFDLTLHKHYQFMEKIEEINMEKVNSCFPVIQHVIKFHKQEFSDAFGIELCEKLQENGGNNLMLPENIAKRVKAFLKDFVVEHIKICDKTLEKFQDKLKDLIMKLEYVKITAELDYDALQVKVVARACEIEKVCEQFRNEIAKMEKVSEGLFRLELQDIPRKKREFLIQQGFNETLTEHHNVIVTIDDQKHTLNVQGDLDQILNAEKEILAQIAQIVDETVDVSDARYDYLTSGGLTILNTGLKMKALKAMAYLKQAKKNQVNILFIDVGTVNSVTTFMNEIMFEKQIHVEEDSYAVLKSSKWKDFSENLMLETDVKLRFEKNDPPAISLIGKKSCVIEASHSVNEFIKRNTIVQQCIDTTEGYLKYLSKFHSKEIGEAEREFSLTIALNQETSTIVVQGTKEGVKRAISVIEKVLVNVVKDNICIEKPDMQEYVLSDEGKNFIKDIEIKKKCLISVSVDQDDSPNPEISEFQPNSKLLCSYKMKDKNVSLKLIKADITAYHCDIIVNDANETLQHVGGLAKSVLEVGGYEIQKECDEHVIKEGKLRESECFNGMPGRLPCKRLVHAVAPRWDSHQLLEVAALAFLKMFVHQL